MECKHKESIRRRPNGQVWFCIECQPEMEKLYQRSLYAERRLIWLLSWLPKIQATVPWPEWWDRDKVITSIDDKLRMVEGLCEREVSHKNILKIIRSQGQVTPRNEK